MVNTPLNEKEVEEIKNILSREPTIEELAMFEAQWSEHCSYKSSRPLLKLLHTRGDHVLVGPGRDAAAVEVYPDTVVILKIESHNHPSAVEPYSGAATGIGGVVRDVLTLGAKPIALLDLLYMGNPKDPHANWLIKGIVKGISDYGNRIGIPTLAGDTWFDDAFNKQPLVNVGCIGLVSRDVLIAVINTSIEDGDLVVVYGNPTGRDGLLGSSFASKALSEDVSKEIGAVQIGDPLTEKLLINATLELIKKSVVKFVKDLGGGGLTTALSETLAEFDRGAEIELTRLHLRTNLTPLEILVSESQERMLVIVSPDKLDELKRVLEKYELRFSVIGVVNKTGRLRAYYNGKLVADVPVKELAKPRSIRRESEPPPEALRGLKPVYNLPRVSLEDAILKVFSSLAIVSRKWIYEQYDHEVGVRTVIKPGLGDAAVLRLNPEDKYDLRGIAVKGDANPRYTSLDPFNGAANVVCECFRNLVAVGSTPLAFVDEVNAGNPEKPWHFWYFEMMIKGLSWITSELNTPVVGGKVSFYNEDARGVQVKPTLTVIGVGRIDDVSRAKTFDFKSSNSLILVAGTTYPELGGSEFLKSLFNVEEGEIPRPRPLSELRAFNLVRELVEEDLVISVHDVGVGGLITALLEMNVTGKIGGIVEVSAIPHNGCDIVELLFSETQARYILEIDQGALDEVKRIASKHGVEIGVIGRTLDTPCVKVMNRSKEIANLDLGGLVDTYYNKLVREMEEL
ncbi:MAG: phosphoribosylformylglycinamidine synthase subunit PurL [Desulfurococcaceae archaeon]